VKRTLTLKRESLAELTDADLMRMPGGAAAAATGVGSTCPVTECITRAFSCGPTCGYTGCCPTIENC